jgi:hypothetical protein
MSPERRPMRKFIEKSGHGDTGKGGHGENSDTREVMQRVGKNDDLCLRVGQY